MMGRDSFPPPHACPPSTSDPHPGVAGASARAEHARRKAVREARVRDRHPHLGDLLLALGDAPQHEQAWVRGAEGEERVAAVLAKRTGPGVIVLHDRRIPGRRSNIDHLAVAASGVWVIDSKRYQGTVTVKRPVFGEPKLLIAQRDRSKLIDALRHQVELVTAAIHLDAPDVPVHGVLCMVDAYLPLLGTVTFRGYPLLRPRALAKQLNAPGHVSAEAAKALAALLTQRFPAGR